MLLSDCTVIFFTELTHGLDTTGTNDSLFQSVQYETLLSEMIHVFYIYMLSELYSSRIFRI